MDLFKLMLGAGPTKGFLGGWLKKVIFLKTGYHVDVLLNNVVVKNENGRVSLHLDADASIKDSEFYDILNKLTN